MTASTTGRGNGGEMINLEKITTKKVNLLNNRSKGLGAKERKGDSTV